MSDYWTPSDEAVVESKEKVIDLTRSMTPVLIDWMPSSDEEKLPDWILDLPPDVIKHWSNLIKALGMLQQAHGITREANTD